MRFPFDDLRDEPSISRQHYRMRIIALNHLIQITFDYISNFPRMAIPSVCSNSINLPKRWNSCIPLITVRYWEGSSPMVPNFLRRYQDQFLENVLRFLFQFIYVIMIRLIGMNNASHTDNGFLLSDVVKHERACLFIQ